MASEATNECADAVLEVQDVNSNDTLSLDGGEVCNSVALEIDNALSDDPSMPAMLEGQPQFFPTSTPLRDSLIPATADLEKGKDQVLENPRKANETSMADEEAVSDQSVLSEGIIVNSEGMNKIAAFDSEFPPPDIPLTAVKTEPVDEVEIENVDGDDGNLNLSLTQCALQLQFSENGCAAGVALIKKERIEKIKSKRGRPPKKAAISGKKKKFKQIHMRPNKPLIKYTEISPLSSKISQRGQNLEAREPPVNNTDLCLVCSAPCIITKNRKIPSLPFCRKCKKAYFYQLGHSRRKKDYARCPSDRNCIIHYKNGNHCPVCHLEKFQQILRSSKAAFRSGAAIEQSGSATLQQGGSATLQQGGSATLQRSRRNANEHKDSSIFVNDQQLIQEALKNLPLVVLDKMNVDPDETIDTKDLPDVFITGVKKPNQDKRSVPRMFAMPYEDVVKQEVPYSLNGNESFETENPVIDFSPKSGTSISPMLGAIKFPFGPRQSFSNTSVSSSPGHAKRGRGRPKKTPTPSPGQGKRTNKLASPEILKSILNEPPKYSSFKKVEAGEKDIKIFVFQCGHACSACNNSASSHWLQQHGYQTSEPLQQQQLPGMQADSNLYQKFVEFYNAAVNSAPMKKVPKKRQTSEQPSQPIYRDLFPPTPVKSIRLNMVQTSASSGSSQPQMILIPPPQQHLVGLASPLSASSSSNFGASLPSSSLQTTPSIARLPISPVNVQRPSVDQRQGNPEKLVVNSTSNITDLVPPLVNIGAARMALNSHLMKRDVRLDFVQPNRFILAQQNVPLSLPLQAITPSSSVRQPGAPYLLSPSVHLSGNSNSSSKTKSP